MSGGCAEDKGLTFWELDQSGGLSVEDEPIDSEDLATPPQPSSIYRNSLVLIKD
ncbi:hypothetical protein CC80DRAFT_556629 [Byssothecium circinans]|uniref:Uncharacterized protein n=1 Tax=Byssothecium circinans TaxID=147558 RepID=A0A6A5T8T8_9PLEO|nr:hypothetical protein CC80DRAFT_556629 [Byssothecium circinans]